MFYTSDGMNAVIYAQHLSKKPFMGLESQKYRRYPKKLDMRESNESTPLVFSPTALLVPVLGVRHPVHLGFVPISSGNTP
jgi:hypothetical protein